MSAPDRIDAIAARNQAKNNADRRVEEARKPKAIIYKLDITPVDPDWDNFRNRVVLELKQKSLADVLSNHFQSDQKYLLLPPMRDGIILDLQKKNAAVYKKTMATPAFYGVHNNLATKLTMMHFGLPIEPCSLTNIFNCDNDEDDAGDADPEPARIQRIIYAEKPLEFLDGYHLRSYGLPMLRTKKARPLPPPTKTGPSPNSTTLLAGLDGAPTSSTALPGFDVEKTEKAMAHGTGNHMNHQFHQQSRGNLGGGSSVSMRGGAGHPPWLPPLRTGIWPYFYLFNGTAIPFADPEDVDGSQFLQIALDDIGAELKGDWMFHLDCYNNEAQNKDNSTKPLQNNVRIVVKKSNFDTLWSQTIRGRLYNLNGDWHMVVRPSHEGRRNTFTPGALSVIYPSITQATELRPFFPHPTVRKATYVLHTKDGGEEIPDNDKSFFDAACRLLKLADPKAKFAVWIYKKDQITGLRRFDTSVEVTAKTASLVYQEVIRTSLLSTNFEIVVTAPDEMLEDNWTPQLPWLYGYAGKVRTSADQGAFITTALELLAIDPVGDYTFYVDFIGTDESLPASTITVQKKTVGRTFHNQIHGLLPRVGPWNAFVRKVGPKPDILEPKDKFIVKLNLNDARVGYWKYPTNLLVRYGINQFQNDFRRAMYVLFPPTNIFARPKTNVHLDKYSLGIGGLDLMSEAWSQISMGLGVATHATTLKVTVDAEIPPEDDEDPVIDIRLAGSTASAVASIASPRAILKEITSLSKKIHAKDLPASFDIWPSALARENDSGDVKFTTIAYTPISPATKAMKTFIDTLSNSPSCLWIHPKWDIFTIVSVDATGEPLTTTTWDATKDRSLGAFRAKLLADFDEGQGNWESFAVWNVEEPSNSYKLIDSKTEPCDWRKDVFGWFLSPNIEVRRTKNEYKLSKTDRWGLVEEPKVAPTRPTPKSSSSRNTPTSASIMAAIPPPKRFNQERIIKQQAKPRVPTKFEPWIAEQNRLDRLQRESYSRSISVIEPGQQPAAVLYGPAKELILAAGNSMPAVYIQRLTPTDIRQLVDENGELRNEVLERRKKCEFCTTTFESYQKDDIRLHYKAHADALQAAGNCPMCGQSWAVMNTTEKRTHLLLHQESIENTKMTDFWKDHTCPVCDIDLHKMSPEEILKHMSNHQPGLVRFCSRCSFDLEAATNVELRNHTDKCKEVLQQYDREFCTQCSKERSHETDEQWANHKRDGICNQSNQHFCPKCSVNEDDLPHPVWLSHKNHRCRTPGGLRKTFCGKCAKNLKKMTHLELESHRQDCFLKEPKTLSEKARHTELTRNIRLESRLVKANKADSSRLRAKEKALKELEDILVVREDRVQNLESIAIQAKVDNAAITKLIKANKGDETVCPFAACEFKVGLLTKADAITHFTNMHAAGNVYFACPIDAGNGQKCGERIKVTADGTDLRRHYGTSHALPSINRPTTISPSTAVQKLRYALTKPEGYVAQANSLATAAGKLNDHTAKTTHPTPVGASGDSLSIDYEGVNDHLNIIKPSFAPETTSASLPHPPQKPVIKSAPRKAVSSAALGQLTFSPANPPLAKPPPASVLTRTASSPRKSKKRPREGTPVLPEVTASSDSDAEDVGYASSDIASPTTSKLKRAASTTSSPKKRNVKKAKIDKSPAKKIASKKEAKGSASLSRAASTEVESRRITRATSGTPAPTTGPVAPKKVGRPKKQVEIQEEEEEDDESSYSEVEEDVDADTVASPKKSGRSACGKSPKKK